MSISSQPPSLPNYSNVQNFSSDTKPADPDIVLVSPEALPVDIQAQLVLQALGGSELIQIVRNDSVNGQTIAYKPIANLDSFASQFSPTSITGYAPSLKGLKSSFSIQIDSSVNLSESSTGPVYVAKDIQNKVGIEVSLENITDQDIVQISTAATELNNIFSYRYSLDGGESSSIDNYKGVVDGGTALGYNVDNTTDGGNA